MSAPHARLFELLEGMARSTEGMDRNQRGYHIAEGWNAAIKQVMDYVRGGALAEPPALPEAQIDLVRKALNRAWHLGQSYWVDADHEWPSRNRRAEETRAKFEALVEETCAALERKQP